MPAHRVIEMSGRGCATDAGHRAARYLLLMHTLSHRSQIRQDYPLNLSISVSGGKETNKDSLSNGE